MKKKIITILTIFLGIIILWILCKNFKVYTKKIIAEDSYMNWAYGFSYSGTVICSDGSIYKFSMDGKENEYKKASNKNNLKSMNKCILKNTTSYVGKVSRMEMNKIREYLKSIDDKYYSQSPLGATPDAGGKSIEIWNYKLNKTITLETRGGAYGNNTSPNADELIKLIRKYTKK